jgi:hypothetical protein
VLSVGIVLLVSSPRLEGRIDVNCNAGRVTLKDATSRRTYTVTFGGGVSSIGRSLL